MEWIQIENIHNETPPRPGMIERQLPFLMNWTGYKTCRIYDYVPLIVGLWRIGLIATDMKNRNTMSGCCNTEPSDRSQWAMHRY